MCWVRCIGNQSGSNQLGGAVVKTAGSLQRLQKSTDVQDGWAPSSFVSSPMAGGFFTNGPPGKPTVDHSSTPLELIF